MSATMSLNASEIFRFLDTETNFTFERQEFLHPEFNSLRSGLLRIILRLNESDEPDAKELSDILRTALSDWLTSPVRFDLPTLWVVVDAMGTERHVQDRWGDDLFALYDHVSSVALELCELTNPLREQLQTEIRQLSTDGVKFKVYCHRRARPLFETLFQNEGLPVDRAGMFLHSVPEYRESELFDVLLKVGPLRSRGWGAVPDALLNAPRFRHLVQFVWGGCADEPGFGFDPVSPVESDDGALVTAQTSSVLVMGGQIVWNKRLVRQGQEAALSDMLAVGFDELQEFSQREGDVSRTRNAVLVQIDGEQGILYPPHSKVISFDPRACSAEAVALRIPGNSLTEGMFLLIPILVEGNDSGDPTAEQGIYSQRWKAKLKDTLAARAKELAKHLRDDGLHLIDLDAALQRWSKPQTTVIHAPQRSRHFKILLDGLGLSSEKIQIKGARRDTFLRLAWVEICRSRGEAIQAGVQDNQQTERLSLAVLQELTTEITEQARESATFQLDIPPGLSISGHFHIYRIHGVEEGFSVPENEIKVIRDLREIDQWRV